MDIDDFGTGYSSLSQLQHLPVQTLKIDRSFVARMDQDAESLEISRMIVALAHNLGLDVIAEGVETARQAAQLRTLGCGFAQGYYFGRPADPQTIWAMVSQPAAVPAELLGQVPPSGDSELARLEAPC